MLLRKVKPTRTSLRAAKRGILEWVENAKTPETRHKRVDETARLASDNVRANQWRPKPAQ